MFPEVEDSLLEFVTETRNCGYAVSTEMLRLKALEIARSKGIPATAFKASNGWIRRFMARKNLSIRRRTTMCQRLPEEYEEKLLAFQKFVIKMRREHGYIASQIGNADQTPVWFDAPENVTVEAKGKKSIHVRTTGAERQRCTVMLCITADGRKLPPYVVFKRKRVPAAQFPNGVIVRAQEKGWMTDDLVKDWLKCVWEKRPGADLGARSLLVLDSFRGHLTENVREQLRASETDLAVIPGGMTGMLQPLDVSVNRPFKCGFRRAYSEWMASTVHQKTPTGRLKRASLVDVCGWILEAWSAVSFKIVENSFKVTGISNKLDGTEDDVIWESRQDDVQTSSDESSGDE